MAVTSIHFSQVKNLGTAGFVVLNGSEFSGTNVTNR